MKIAHTFLLTAVLAAGAVSAKNLRAQGNSTASAAAHFTAVISGIVIKEPGPEPVKKALIELITENQSEGGNYTAVSGPDGSFRIENILPGRYRLFVERTGYQEVNQHNRGLEGRILTLAANQEIRDLTLRLQAAAVVEGRVTDEDGDAMAEAQVAVLRQTFVSGRSHWEQAGAERTNDLGEYRISGLAPGNYFISVSPPPDVRNWIETTANAASSPHTAATDKAARSSYQTTYYPSTRDRSQAIPIQLHAGDDFPANFSLTPGPSLSIRGSVVNLPQGTTAAILLQSKEFNLMLNGAEMHKDGSFEIRDVSPGAYTILATVDGAEVPMLARQALQVGSANVDGVRLAPQPGGSVVGRLRLEGKASGPAPDPSQMFLQLRPADGDDDMLAVLNLGDSSALAHVNRNGTFAWKNIPAGRYFLEISDSTGMPEWFLKSAFAGGQDALDSGLTVGGGVTTLDVVASSNGGVIEGVAANRKDDSEKNAAEPTASEQSVAQSEEPAADVTIVAVPEARFRSHPDRYRKTTTDQRGHFALRGLPPGEYSLFAWESVDGEAYLNPEFLRSYEGQGKAIRVGEGERVSMQLTVVQPAGNQPEGNSRLHPKLRSQQSRTLSNLFIRDILL